VADWTIQCHARSGPLVDGSGLLLTAGFDSLAQCFRATTCGRRPIPIRFARVISVGVTNVASRR
jgi:hypothetical protein